MPPLIIPLPANIFPNKLAVNVAANKPKNPLFYSYTSFSAVSLTPFIKKTDSSRDLTIFIISFKSSFENTNVFVSEPNIFFRIAVSVAEAAAFNPKGTKTLLTNVLSTFTIKGKLGFTNGPISLP